MGFDPGASVHHLFCLFVFFVRLFLFHSQRGNLFNGGFLVRQYTHFSHFGLIMVYVLISLRCFVYYGDFIYFSL